MARWLSKACFLEIVNLTSKTKVISFLYLVYCYDKKNNIFSEIIYGPRKKSKKKDPNDFIHGTIYSLKPEFVSKF